MLDRIINWIKRNEIAVFLYLILIIIISMLLILNDPRWSFFCIGLWLWVFIVIFYTVFIICRPGFCYLFKKSNDYFIGRRIRKGKKESKGFSKKINQFLLKFNTVFYSSLIAFVISFVLITNLLPFTSYMGGMTQWKADQNYGELEKIVNNLIKNESWNNETKTKLILSWFNEYDHNIYNDYRLWDKGFSPLRLDGGQIELYCCEPYIGVRTYADDFSLWILTSRYGHCGEYALLFRDMGLQAGLNVSKITCSGENHCWNEVYINDTIGWKTVDATQVFLSDYNGYDNVSPENMLNKLSGNISRAIAEFKQGKTVDVTQNYTTVVNITVTVRDAFDSPINNASVKIYSNNRDKGRYTEISVTTNQSGQHIIKLGCGNYTFRAWNDDRSMHGETTKIFPEEMLWNEAVIEISRKDD